MIHAETAEEGARMTRVCVTGAGGFIGHHLVTFLKQQGHWVRGVDLKHPEFTEVDAVGAVAPADDH